MQVYPACQQLLNESEFAKTWKVKRDGYGVSAYRKTGNYYFAHICKCYDDATTAIIIAELHYLGYGYDDNILLSLLIHSNGTFDMIDDFIRDYNIAPYTYIVSHVSINAIPPNIKPFAYILIRVNDTFQNVEQLPLCIVYTGDFNVNSVFRYNDISECDTNPCGLEYEAATRLQKNIPLTKLKSANNLARLARVN